MKDPYTPYSRTASGWKISENSNARANKRWRAVHPYFGEKFFAQHDEVLEFTVRNMLEQFEEVIRRRMKKNDK